MTRIVTGLVLGGLWLLLLLAGPQWLLGLVVLAGAGGVAAEVLAMALPETTPGLRLALLAPAVLPVTGALAGGASGLAPGVAAGLLVGALTAVLAGGRLAKPAHLLLVSVFTTGWVGFCAAHLLLLATLEEGRWWVLLLTATVVASDAGAYYTGTRLGRHKLCPRVSPNKTVEGLAGGILAALVVGSAFIPFAGAVMALAGALACGLAAVLGDLTESVLKRGFAVKDSGRLLPGHGGLFDRLDGLLAAAPVLYYLVRYGTL